MRKHPYATVFLFAVFGVVGAVLRYIHSKYYYDEAGLPITGPVSSALIAVSIAAAIAALVLAIVINLKFKTADSFAGTFQSQKSAAPAAVQVIGAVLLAASAVLQNQYGTGVKKGTVVAVTVLGIIAALTMIYIAVSSYKGVQSPALGYMCLLPSLYFCALLIMMFAANARNPIVISFSFECTAIGAAALYISALGGYALKKPQPFSTGLAGFIGITFSVIALTGRTITLAGILRYAGMMCYLLPLQVSFLKNLMPKTKK